MSLLQMLQSLEEENKKDIDDILAGANKEADKIRLLARLKGEETARHEAQIGKEKIKRETGMIVNQGLSSKRHKIASVKQEIFDETVREVIERFSALRSDPEYKTTMKTLFTEARVSFEKDAKIIVIVAEEDVAIMRGIIQELTENAEVKIGDVEFGGLQISTQDARMIVDNSIRKRLETALVKLKPELSKILFGDVV